MEASSILSSSRLSWIQRTGSPCTTIPRSLLHWIWETQSRLSSWALPARKSPLLTLGSRPLGPCWTASLSKQWCKDSGPSNWAQLSVHGGDHNADQFFHPLISATQWPMWLVPATAAALVCDPSPRSRVSVLLAIDSPSLCYAGPRSSWLWYQLIWMKMEGE